MARGGLSITLNCLYHQLGASVFLQPKDISWDYLGTFN